MNATSLTTALRALALTSTLGAAFLAAPVQAQSIHRQAVSAGEGTGLTRAEVIADTRLWVRAGVDKHADVAQYDVDNRLYQQALAEYHRLRNSPAYAEEVARVEAERGQVPATRLSRQ